MKYMLFLSFEQEENLKQKIISLKDYFGFWKLDRKFVFDVSEFFKLQNLPDTLSVTFLNFEAKHVNKKFKGRV